MCSQPRQQCIANEQLCAFLHQLTDELELQSADEQRRTGHLNRTIAQLNSESSQLQHQLKVLYMTQARYAQDEAHMRAACLVHEMNHQQAAEDLYECRLALRCTEGCVARQKKEFVIHWRRNNTALARLTMALKGICSRNRGKMPQSWVALRALRNRLRRTRDVQHKVLKWNGVQGLAGLLAEETNPAETIS